jgi:hypothetical protein
MDTLLLYVVFARLSELRSVLQDLIPELILSPKCHNVYVQKGPICNGCWVWSSWSVAAHFTHDIINHTRNSHLCYRDNPHGTLKNNYQHRFAANVWCGIIGDQLIGPYIFPQRLTGDIYANFLQDDLSALLGNVPLYTRRQMYYQHDGAPPHFSQVVKQYLNHRFPKWWIGRGGAHNWPTRSPYLNPLDCHVWGYTKDMVYAHEVNTREELLHQILGAARSINNAAVLRKVTSCLVTRVKKFIQADRHFEKLAWVLKGGSVTVHLTTYLNKCTTLLFPF